MAGYSKTGKIVVGNFDVAKNHADPERWVRVYPAYLNANKTREEGRRISKSLCVPDPVVGEIQSVLEGGGFTNTIFQYKEYPRERSREAVYRGRILIQLKDAEGNLLREEFPSRKSIFKFVGEEISKLREGKKKQALPAKQESVQPSKQAGKKSKKKK